jgi:hypothetical protein
MSTPDYAEWIRMVNEEASKPLSKWEGRVIYGKHYGPI